MTSPLVYEITVPLTFLGSVTYFRDVKPELIEGPTRQSKRLEFFYQALKFKLQYESTEKDVQIKIHDDHPTAAEDEEEVDDDVWLLRCIPDSGAEIHTRAQPTLSTQERDAARKRNVFTLCFTLSRLGIPDDGFQNACEELAVILTACSFEPHGSGAQVRVVVGEAQSPSIVLRPKRPSNASLSATARRTTLQQPRPFLQEPFVRSVVLAFTAFERELCTLASPPFLLKYCPLSHLLFMGEVRKLRREKRVVWKRMTREWEDGRKDRSKQEQEVSRLLDEWGQGIKDREQERNVVVERREAMAGVRERDWWRLVEQWFEYGSWEGYQLVKDLVEMTKRGRSAVLGLHVADDAGVDGDDDEEMDPSTTRANERDKEFNTNPNSSKDPKAANPRKRKEDRSLPSPHPSLPEISHLTVHLPPSHLHKTLLANLHLTYAILDLARIPDAISEFLAQHATALAFLAEDASQALPQLANKLGVGYDFCDYLFKDLKAFDDALQNGEKEGQNEQGEGGDEQAKEGQTGEGKPVYKNAIGRVEDAFRTGCEQGRRAVLQKRTGEGYLERYRRIRGWEVVPMARIVQMLTLEELKRYKRWAGGR